MISHQDLQYLALNICLQDLLQVPLLLPLLQAAERMDLWGDGADGVTAAARKEAFDAPLLPLVTLQYVCEVEAEAARQMREEVFPAAVRSQATIPKPDRPLPEGATLREHLLKQMTASQMVLKKVCADLVFAMCEEDVSDFVTLTGIGNDAGLLQERNLFAAMAGARELVELLVEERSDFVAEDFL